MIRERYALPPRQDGGMHFVAWLRGRLRDTELVELLSRKRIGPAPLSRCSLRAPGYNGLMIGYANVAKEQATTAARRMLAAIERVR